MSNKKKRDIKLFIADIFVAIQKIKIYTKNFKNPNELQHNSLHWDATIRQLEIIGEALNKLLEDEEFSLLSPRYFRKVVNFRNNIIHGYFGIDLDEVWSVVTIHLDKLLEDLMKIVKNNIDISEAIYFEIEEYKKLNEVEIVKFLIDLKL